jgi:hypothetical protein
LRYWKHVSNILACREVFGETNADHTKTGFGPIHVRQLHTMTPNKSQRLFLRQYRELHESRSPKRVLLDRILMSCLGSVGIVVVMAMLLYFASPGALQFFVPFAAGLLVGNSASQLGGLMRRMMAWDVVEQITDWPKVYGLLGNQRPENSAD